MSQTSPSSAASQQNLSESSEAQQHRIINNNIENNTGVTKNLSSSQQVDNLIININVHIGLLLHRFSECTKKPHLG